MTTYDQCQQMARVRREKGPRHNRIYIAGPMSAFKDTDWNYPAFNTAARLWRISGWEVLNPAESFNGRTDLPYVRYMRNALKLVMRCGAIALLPGWETSTGACMEVLVAARQEYEFFDALTGVSIPIPNMHANQIPVHSGAKTAG